MLKLAIVLAALIVAGCGNVVGVSHYQRNLDWGVRVPGSAMHQAPLGAAAHQIATRPNSAR